MKPVNLRRHNLNAFPVLREILRQGNLTRASVALGLTQPALSNILRQLRMDFDDPLIVRNGKSMQLTAKATALMGPLEDALSSIEALLSVGSFDPANSTKQFRVATTDHMVTMLSPCFMRLAIAEAPMTRTQMTNAQTSSVKELMVGDLDIVISPKMLLTAGIADAHALDNSNTELLLSERMVCLAHKDDAEFSAGLSLQDYLERPHAGYCMGDRTIASIEQVYLARLGLKQNDMLLLSSYAALPATVAISGCLALVPESMASRAIRMLPLQYAPPPFPTDSIDWTMVWHLRNEKNPDIIWLRDAFKRAVAPLTNIPVDHKLAA
jgi:LysR family transcriptional regulator, nod-box dependent transcriptional activator